MDYIINSSVTEKLSLILTIIAGILVFTVFTKDVESVKKKSQKVH